MIPDFQPSGLLPPGIHDAAWSEFVAKFATSIRRRWLLEGLLDVLRMLRSSGCRTVYVDGSFVTEKSDPEDYDALWDAIGVRAAELDPMLFQFDAGRVAQKLKFRGELFPVSATVDEAGITFLEFFQICKLSGASKGIVRIELSSLP